MNRERVDAFDVETEILKDLQDRLRAAVSAVSRLQREVAAQNMIVQALAEPPAVTKSEAA